MKPLFNLIAKNSILSQAVKAVKGTKRSLLVTMLLREEMGRVPKQYELELIKALDRGVKIARVCFGSVREMKFAADYFDKRIQLQLIKDKRLYQRMILVDDGLLLCRLGDDFFQTGNKLVIRGFKDYIQSLVKAKI